MKLTTWKELTRDWVAVASIAAATFLFIPSAAPGLSPDAKRNAEDITRRSISLPALLRMRAEQPVIIIDLRPEKYFTAGHIPGAVNIPASASAAELKDAVSVLTGRHRRSEAAVLYEQAAVGTASVAMQRLLAEGGFHNSYYYAGEWVEWKACRLDQSI